MVLNVSQTIKNDLPSSLLNTLGKMPEDQQAVFEDEYMSNRRSPVLFLLLAIFFPIHFFLEGRIGLGILFWITFGGFGIWWLIEIFTVYGRTRNANQEEGRKLLRDMKIMA